VRPDGNALIYFGGCEGEDVGQLLRGGSVVIGWLEFLLRDVEERGEAFFDRVLVAGWAYRTLHKEEPTRWALKVLAWRR